jgi:aryl-alcohol dehydrogenase-like predicted oxidoreductase
LSLGRRDPGRPSRLVGDPPISPIVGVSTAEQLDEALAARNLQLSDDQRRRLDEAA